MCEDFDMPFVVSAVLFYLLRRVRPMTVAVAMYEAWRRLPHLGELTAILGLTLATNHIIIPLLSFAGLTAIQLTRMHYEERVLTATFPEYAVYANDVSHRLIPGIY